MRLDFIDEANHWTITAVSSARDALWKLRLHLYVGKLKYLKEIKTDDINRKCDHTWARKTLKLVG